MKRIGSDTGNLSADRSTVTRGNADASNQSQSTESKPPPTPQNLTIYLNEKSAADVIELLGEEKHLDLTVPRTEERSNQPLTLNPKGLETLCEVMRKGGATRLTLDNVTVPTISSVLKAFVGGNVSIRHLDLNTLRIRTNHSETGEERDFGLQPHHGETIAQDLKQNISLLSLNLSGLGKGDHCVKPILEALASNRSLKNWFLTIAISLVAKKSVQCWNRTQH